MTKSVIVARDVKKELANMNLTEKFLFDAVMEHTEAYEAAVSILLEREIHLLSPAQSEKEFRVSPQLRSARLDIISTDVERQIYFTEMQAKNTHNLEKRSRFYQAQVDVSLLVPGEADFNKLPDACFILIAPFDIFGKGLYRYTFIGTCQECPELKLNDGAMRIFINTRGKNGEGFSWEFLELMRYVEETTDEVAACSESMRIKTIHEVVKKVRVSEKMGVKLMQRWEEEVMIREESFREGHDLGVCEGQSQGLSQGLSQGRREGKTETLIELVLDGTLSVEEAAKRLEMRVEDFEKELLFEIKE